MKCSPTVGAVNIDKHIVRTEAILTLQSKEIILNNFNIEISNIEIYNMRTEGAILGKPLFAAATFTQFAQFYALAIIDTFNIKCDKERLLKKNYRKNCECCPVSQLIVR